MIMSTEANIQEACFKDMTMRETEIGQEELIKLLSIYFQKLNGKGVMRNAKSASKHNLLSRV